MFIELTDHLRCPVDHPEAYLVLLPALVQERDVVEGQLGCPVCGWTTRFSDGVVDFGEGRPGEGPTALTGEAVQAFLGLGGPGGYVVMVGAAAPVIPDAVPLLPGIHFVALNPPERLPGSPGVSVLRSGRIPLKASSMRGTVLGADAAADPHWVREAIRVTLAGRHIVGEGPVPEPPKLEILASGGGAWVGRKAARRI